MMRCAINFLKSMSGTRVRKHTSHKSGLIFASQVVGLIGLLLVFDSQRIVHNVLDEMAEFVVPLRMKIKDCPTRQGP